MNHIARMTVAAGGCLLLLASCTVLNSTFGASDASTGAEASGSRGHDPIILRRSVGLLGE